LEEVRKELESRKKSPSYLVEWVHGELLYNKSLKLTANVALSDAPADKSLPIALSPQTEQPVRVAANAQSGLAPLSTERKAILSEARTHLVRARQLRSCGTRADAISDLIVIVERELEGQGTVSGSGGPHPALPTNRSVGILGAPQSTDSATPVAKSQARPAAPVAKNPATPACDDLGSDGLDTGELRRLAMIEIAEAGPLPLFDFYH
jgi:hypothetical protein